MKSSPSSRVLRIGSVSYLNARPLIHGLEEQGDLSLELEVPARLLEGLRGGRFDVALLPVIDYQRMEDLRLVPSGGIGCDGPTLTVRIFSDVPITQIRALACDSESHTSVALARVVLAERYGIRPELVEWSAGQFTRCDARLLIGDKVVCEEPGGFAHELDLGEAWKELTGLPFVFAAWMARAGRDLGDLPQRLERARESGVGDVEQIVARHGTPRGWPAETAVKYLTEYLRFEVGERQIEAIERFHRLAHRHGLLNGALLPLRLYEPPAAIG